MDMLNAGQEAQARAFLEAHLKKRPSDAIANKLMAMIHGAHHQDEQAYFYIQRAAFAAPKDGHIRFMQANVALSLKRYKEAAAAYKECVKIAPGDVGSLDGLAKCQISMGQYDLACQSFEAAIAAHPEDPSAWGNYANALVLIAKLDKALEVAKRGLIQLPDNPALLEFIAYSSNFPSQMDNVELRQWHERLGRVFAQEREKVPPHVLTNSLDPHKPLKVGFLSGDFSLHACSFFMKGPLLHFDPSQVIPYCFSTQSHVDGGDEPFKKHCQWRDVSELSLDDTARAIVHEGIDILIECSGLTQGHRLRALIPRVAPLQCTWLGYPNTTGIPTMDYRIVDAVSDPPEHDNHKSEKPLRLPGCFLCFTPDPQASEPELTPATLAFKDGPNAGATKEPIVFGSFNRMTKVSPATIDAWCAVLRAVPDSKMLLKLRIMSDELAAEARAHFTSRGIDGARIEMVPFTSKSYEHSRMYSRMDIALDAFPYNGTTTTCEATWMGVPVVVMSGESHRSRVGMTLNTALGLEELIASDVTEYIDIAQRLAHDRTRLAQLKMSLRERMRSSRLCDAQSYARGFEQALRGVWTQWAQGPAKGR